MTGKPFHHHPEKNRSFSGANVRESFRRQFIHFPNVGAVEFAPIIRLHHIERTGIDFASGTTDTVAVVLDDEQERQFLFFRKTNSFVKIALPGCSIANGCDHNSIFLIQFDSPRYPARRQKL